MLEKLIKKRKNTGYYLAGNGLIFAAALLTLLAVLTFPGALALYLAGSVLLTLAAGCCLLLKARANRHKHIATAVDKKGTKYYLYANEGTGKTNSNGRRVHVISSNNWFYNLRERYLHTAGGATVILTTERRQELTASISSNPPPQSEEGSILIALANAVEATYGVKEVSIETSSPSPSM